MRMHASRHDLRCEIRDVDKVGGRFVIIDRGRVARVTRSSTVKALMVGSYRMRACFARIRT